MDVNLQLPLVCVWPWVSIWEVDGARTWIHNSLDRFNSIETGPEAAAQIAELVREDLVPWLKSWPPKYLAMLRVSLEYGLVHDQVMLRELEEWTALGVADSTIDALWRPLWDGLYGGEPQILPLEDYRVLSEREARKQLNDFEPSPPHWEWLTQLEADVAEQRVAQRATIFLLQQPQDRFLAEEEKATQFGRTLLAEGLMALDAARVWNLTHPNELWPVPDSGPISPTLGPGRIREPLEIFCSAQRAPEWTSKRQPTVSFDELGDRLQQAGYALGLSADSIEANIALAWKKHAASNHDFEPWKSWATIAQALLDAREADLFLRL